MTTSSRGVPKHAEAPGQRSKQEKAPYPHDDPILNGLQVYIVGGAVRDRLLGQPAGDRDWVVVGATPETMAERGFIPVGGDFPVFLHPKTKEEFALARTERKSGRGYKGFTFYTGQDVSLEEDLKRRDLTINAMAQTPEGDIVDPLNGQQDLQAKLLRHVGDAFVEDPVRLLRLARFAARFVGFSVAPQTMDLARRLVSEGEVDALVPERVWREMAKGLATAEPGRMFEVLLQADALPRVVPGLVFNEQIHQDLHCAAQYGYSLPQRFALLCRLSASPEKIGRHLRAPYECIDYARLLPVLIQGLNDHSALAEDWLVLIERTDGLRKPQRFMDLVQATQCVQKVDAAVWQQRLAAVASIDAGAIAKAANGNVADIKSALRNARLNALRAAS